MQIKTITTSLLALSCTWLSAEFVEIFNGKDFTGWGAPGKQEQHGYIVKDGVIESTPQCRVLFTDRQFTDYVLEFEFQLTPGANNGLGIHYPGQGDGSAEGMEIQMLDETHEKYKDLEDYQFHGSLYFLAAAKSGHLKPVGEWNQQRVTVQGADLKVELNGTEILNVNLDEINEQHPDHKGSHRRNGRIAFLGHGDIVRMKNLRVDEGVPVKSDAMYYTEGKADERLAASGFTSLFNGKDLSGWRQDKGHEGHWVAKDGWILSYDGKSEAEDKNLWTEKSYENTVLVCDWRWAEEGTPSPRPIIDRQTGDEVVGKDGKVKTLVVGELDSGIYLRGSSKSQVNMWNWPIGSGEVYGYRVDKNQPAEVRAGVTPKATADNPVGQWNRFVITTKGDRFTAVLNGLVVIEDAQLPGIPESGPFALQHHGQAIEFANIYIKELK